MKFNLSFGRGRRSGGGSKLDIKQFFLHHAEKILLTCACLFMAALVAWGYRSGSDFESNKTPQNLEQQVSSAQRSMNQERWETVYKPQRDRSDRVALTDRANEALVTVSVDSYPTPMPWKPLIFPPQTKRNDPNLLPVIDLTAKSGYGALSVRRDEVLASRTGGDIDDFDANIKTRSLPNLDELELEETSESVGGGAVKGVHFVCLTGLIPFQAQLDQYNESFQNAAGYNTRRDFPRYYIFRVRRVLVEPGGGEPKWEELPWPTDVNDKLFIESWGGRPQELADVRYVLQEPAFAESLFQVPPLLRQDLTKWAVHPGIPHARSREELDAMEEDMREDVRPDASDPFGQRGAGDFGREGEYSEERSDWRSGGEEGGRDGYSGDTDVVTEHKLFRYFDFGVEPGKTYQYQVRLWLEDPNYPEDGGLRLGLRMLSTEAANRIRPKMQTTKRANHFRETPWSDSTTPITVSSGKELLAGSVIPIGTIPIRSRNIRFDKPYDEPRAKVVVLDWDDQLAANIPVEKDVRRGTTANFTQETEYLRPNESILVTRTHQFNTDAVVVDIAGGAPLASRIRGEGLTKPGEILVLDAQGNLTRRDELNDLDSYKQNTFREADPESDFGGSGGEDERSEDGELYTPADERR